MSIEIEEGWFSPDPSTRLYTKTWKPPAQMPLNARLAFLHGFSDHCNAYYNLFPSLAARGIEVHAFDQRGWGRSVSKKSEQGNTGSTNTVLADIVAFLKHITTPSKAAQNDRDESPAPLFLMGHSMGGAEAILLALHRPQFESVPPIRGILLESPFISLHPDSQPNAVTYYAGKLAAKVLPKHQLLQKLEPRYLSRNPQVCQEWVDDELNHDTGTLEGLAQMLQRASDLTAFAHGQTKKGISAKTSIGLSPDGLDSVPVWIGHGTEDRVTCPKTSRQFFERLDVKDKTYKSYEGAYHKLHAEPDGLDEEFTKDVADWIIAKTGEQNGATEDSVKPKL